MALVYVGFFLGMLLLLVRRIVLCCVTSDTDELPSSHQCLCLLGMTSLCLPRFGRIIITPPNSPVRIGYKCAGVWYGIQVACLTLYAGLCLGLVLLLRQAQQMVENVSRGGDERNACSQVAAATSTAAVAAAAPTSAVAVPVATSQIAASGDDNGGGSDGGGGRDDDFDKEGSGEV